MIRARQFWPHSGAAASIPAVDGLRAVAVLLTIIFHAWFVIPGIHDDITTYDFPLNYGRTGVQLFFVLSGFLLFQPYARWILGNSRRPSLKTFYLRRLRRVAPAYWAALIILVVLQSPTISMARDVTLHIVWLHNLTRTSTWSFNPVFWTMAVEVQFYAILPLCAGALHWLVRRLRLWPAVTLFFGALFLVSIADATVQTVYPNTANLPVIGTFVVGTSGLPCWLGVFACGMCLRMLAETSALRGTPLTGYAAVVGAAVLALTVITLPVLHRMAIHDFLFGPVYAALLYAALSLPWLTRLFSWKPLRFIGLISYSLYLWHYVIIRLFDAFLLGQVQSVPLHVLLSSVVAIAVGVPFAYLWYQVVERPFLTQKPSYSPGSVPAMAMANRD